MEKLSFNCDSHKLSNYKDYEKDLKITNKKTNTKKYAQ